MVSQQAPADWTQIHRDASHNAVEPVASAVTDLSTVTDPTLVGESDIVQGIRPLIFEGNVYVPVERSVGMATEHRLAIFPPNSQPATIKTVPLKNRIFGSVSTPAIDPIGRRIYYPTGNSLYAFSADDLTFIFETPVDATNTTPAAAGYDFINGSPTLGAGKVFVSTFDPSFGGAEAQLIAFDAVTGAIDWFALPGGFGVSAPSFVDTGAQQLVIVPASAGGGASAPARAQAYDAITGALVWDAATITSPWQTQRQFWTEFVADGSGDLVGITLDFGVANTEILKFDAATGALAWLQPGLSADCPPILTATRAWIYGGAFGASQLISYDLSDGSQDALVAINSTVFRDYMAATNDSLYLTANGEIERRDIGTGALLSSTSGGSYTGPVSLASDGSVFAHDGVGDVAATGPGVALGIADWSAYE